MTRMQARMARTPTPRVAARQEALRVVIELEPRYVQLSIERWERFTGKTAEKADG